jgi:hypothetical protein
VTSFYKGCKNREKELIIPKENPNTSLKRKIQTL